MAIDVDIQQPMTSRRPKAEKKWSGGGTGFQPPQIQTGTTSDEESEASEKGQLAATSGFGLQLRTAALQTVVSELLLVLQQAMMDPCDDLVEEGIVIPHEVI